MNYCHFLYCPFTGLGLFNGYRGDEWLKKRLRIFKQFSLPSILNQSADNFYLWISWRPEERENPIVREFVEYMDSFRGLHVIHTFDGVCFYDDKYEPDVAKARLLTSLSRSLPQMKDHVGSLEHVLVTIQPSDDMYMSYAVKEMQGAVLDSSHEVSAVGYSNGYIMNLATKEIAEYITNTNPPFYTIKMPAQTFLDPWKHLAAIGPYESHEYVKDHMPFTVLGGRGFCVGTHGANISTTFNHMYKGRTLQEGERDHVLCELGVYFSDTVVINTGIHLLVRKALNALPFSDILRKLYRSLPVWCQRF